MVLINTKNRKTNEPHKFALNLSQRLELKRSNKHVALQNLSIYYTWKNTRNNIETNILKIVAPTWNGEFELPDRSHLVSDIQDYIKCTIKKHKTLTKIRSIHVQINRMNNKFVFETKDGYKLELRTPETMKLFGSTKS